MDIHDAAFVHKTAARRAYRAARAVAEEKEGLAALEAKLDKHTAVAVGALKSMREAKRNRDALQTRLEAAQLVAADEERRYNTKRAQREGAKQSLTEATNRVNADAATARAKHEMELADNAFADADAKMLASLIAGSAAAEGEGEGVAGTRRGGLRHLSAPSSLPSPPRAPATPRTTLPAKRVRSPALQAARKPGAAQGTRDSAGGVDGRMSAAKRGRSQVVDTCSAVGSAGGAGGHEGQGEHRRDVGGTHGGGNGGGGGRRGGSAGGMGRGKKATKVGLVGSIHKRAAGAHGRGHTDVFVSAEEYTAARVHAESRTDSGGDGTLNMPLDQPKTPGKAGPKPSAPRFESITFAVGVVEDTDTGEYYAVLPPDGQKVYTWRDEVGATRIRTSWCVAKGKEGARETKTRDLNRTVVSCKGLKTKGGINFVRLRVLHG